MAFFRAEADLSDRPRTHPIRPFLRPLRGATITGFGGDLDQGFSLEYEVEGKTGKVDYEVTDNGADFVFQKPNGEVSRESYERSAERPGGDGPPAGREPGGPGNEVRRRAE